jgi:pyruvate dehydrogenase E1 component alpha subunit
MAGRSEGPARSRSVSGKPTQRSSASKTASGDGATSVGVDTTDKAPAAPKGRAAGTKTAPAKAAPAKASRKQAAPTADRDRLVGYYREMTLIREFELKAGEMYTRAKIGGYCHLNLGEEPTVVGVMAALRPTDYIYTNYREHGYALARGMEPGRVMAELFGRTDGVSSGRGGSMHLFDAKRRFLGGYGIVGGQLPPATGAALALTYRGKPGPDAEAVLCQMGDGTTNIGAFHESLNLASIWKLPIVYVVINNGLGMATTVESASGEPELYKRGCSYRIEGRRVDGDDPEVVRQATDEMLRRAREERKPGLLEIMSHRLRGHSVVDPARYRSREETEKLRSLDPLPAYRRKLVADGVMTDEESAQIEAESIQVVDRAVEFADSSPEPPADELFRFTYASPVPNTSTLMPGDPILPAGWDKEVSR